MIGRKIVGMNVWTGLPLRICARTGMLHEFNSFPQCAVLAERESGQATAVIVRDEQPPSRLIDRQMARSRSAGRHVIQKLQRRAVDRERTDGSGLVFVSGVKKATVGMK